MPRIAIGGLWHETNTFAIAPTTLEDFQVLEGSAILDILGGTRTPIGGFLEATRDTKLQVVPAIFASALPSGIVRTDAYTQLSARLAGHVRQIRPDAIFLDLHGAMVAEGVDDVEGDLIHRLRRQAGNVPVGCVLDLHANISAEFVNRIDVVAGYDTYPHVDPYDRGVEVARLLARHLAGEIAPVRAYEPLPLLTVPQAQATDRPPMAELMRLAHEAEDLPGMLTVTVAAGFPYADVPFAGLSVVAVADGDLGLAGTVARNIAEAAWTRREGFRVQNLPPEQAVRRAMAADRWPVVLVEVADNVGGGASGDGTVLLEALLQARARGAVMSVVDPEAVGTARRAGEGAMMAVAIGGKSDPRYSSPVPVRARVRRIARGDFTYRGSYMTGRAVEGGWAAVLEADGVHVIVRERPVMPFDQEELRVLGLDPETYRIIIVKSAIAWRAAYGSLAQEVIEVDTPGVCTARLTALPYRRVRRPVVPLDDDVHWSPVRRSAISS